MTVGMVAIVAIANLLSSKRSDQARHIPACDLVARILILWFPINQLPILMVIVWIVEPTADPKGGRLTTLFGVRNTTDTSGKPAGELVWDIEANISK